MTRMSERMRHITKDGRSLLISEMDDDHLINTIKRIRKKSDEGFNVMYGRSDDDICCEIFHYEGDEALKYLNYESYRSELNYRGLKIWAE